ncbi:hypothetical protein Pmani_039698 [Petrolisthes manimaculis]|uniref:Uncharacterized protein n=1 Tax=Petrolisthes manimaculis TaxID=1843537 RepID=A0AAE1NC21_9EUCA|nr:hypothetical protein Pmani_039698 [Petrolisthes manimaculis]
MEIMEVEWQGKNLKIESSPKVETGTGCLRLGRMGGGVGQEVGEGGKGWVVERGKGVGSGERQEEKGEGIGSGERQEERESVLEEREEVGSGEREGVG